MKNFSSLSILLLSQFYLQVKVAKHWNGFLSHCSSQQLNNEEGSQWPNNEDEAAEGLQQPNSGYKADEDKGSENESDTEEIGVGSQKYKKQIKDFRVSIHPCLP